MLSPRLLALVAVIAVSLSGCTADAPPPTPSLTPPAESQELLNPELQPEALPVVTEATAQAEGARLADAVQALIDPATVLNVDDASQLAPAEDDLAAYWVVYRTLTLDISVDPLTLAETMTSVLDDSGWEVYESVNEGGTFVAALSGGPVETPWFALVGGDASVEGQSVFTLQIASPDIE